jgi:hypothetical protein
MADNVWQWTDDCYADGYVNAPMMEALPKPRRRAFASIEAARGFIPSGFSAPRLAREIPPTIETQLWDSVWQGRSRERRLHRLSLDRFYLFE